MAENIQDLTALDATAVQDLATQIAAALKTAFPHFDVDRGPMREIVVEPQAVLAQGAALGPIDDWRRSTSLLAITEDPTLASDDAVDKVLSNFQITRPAGEFARGNVVLVTSSATPYVLPVGLLFSADGVLFATEAKYSAKTSAASFTSNTDRLLAPTGDGKFAAVFPIVAVAEGPTGNLKRSTRLTCDVPPRNFVTSYAESDFTGGLSTVDNAGMLDLLAQGAAVKAWTNRTTIEAMIRSQEAFSRIAAMSLVGAGDAEMLRDKHGLFPVGGARCDLYVRTTALPVANGVTVTAQLIGTSEGSGVWQFSIEKASFPGFYRVVRVVRSADTDDLGSFAITEDVREIVLDPDIWQPDIENVQEGAYSPFQAAVIQFVDTRTAMTGLTVGTSTADYAVVIEAMPLIQDLQDYLADPDVRPPGDDILVRAAIPCYVSVALRINRFATQTAPDEATIRAAVADRVNAVGFVGSVYSSELLAAIEPLLSDGMTIDHVHLVGRIRTPAGDDLYVSGADSLTVPVNGALQLSSRTVAFLLDPINVVVTMSIRELPEA